MILPILPTLPKKFHSPKIKIREICEICGLSFSSVLRPRSYPSIAGALPILPTLPKKFQFSQNKNP